MRKDLLYHMIAGFVIAILVSIVLPVWIAFIIGCLAGLGKELYDKYIRHTFFDWKDLACTCFGSFWGAWVFAFII